MTEAVKHTGCCPPFNPEPWDDRETNFDEHLFVKDRVRSFFHIPLNFGKVMMRNLKAIETAGASAGDDTMVISDENSLFGADIYIAVSKEIPGLENTRLPGTFWSKAFEGPFSKVRQWCREMKALAEDKQKRYDEVYFWYTTCPRCAKAYGKNDVVLLARQ